ncbi:uncharacterized protein [Diadema antillarum]|uniref:uncharacterized protein n=1 Tax=Diadema antillarum TaxID=105358 RepID=UPI003A841368
MDSYSYVQSQCASDTAIDVMDSPASANFYEFECDKQFAIKQEQFDIEEPHLELGDFLNCEDSVDLQVYLQQPVANIQRTTNFSGDTAHQVQLEPFESQRCHQSLMNEAADAGAPTLTELSTRRSGTPMHIENIHQPTTVIMPLTTQAHVGSADHHDSSAVVPVFTQEDFPHEVNALSLSVASSPGMPTSADTSRQNSPAPASASSTTISTTSSSKRKRPVLDKNSNEYMEKRQRNNIAVRKSRLKTKEKNKELQSKVGELQEENGNLKKRVEMLTKELTVLKSLFTNVGKAPPARLEKAVE